MSITYLVINTPTTPEAEEGMNCASACFAADRMDVGTESIVSAKMAYVSEKYKHVFGTIEVGSVNSKDHHVEDLFVVINDFYWSPQEVVADMSTDTPSEKWLAILSLLHDWTNANSRPLSIIDLRPALPGTVVLRVKDMAGPVRGVITGPGKLKAVQ